MRRPTIAPGLLAVLAAGAIALTACTPPQGAAAESAEPSASSEPSVDDSTPEASPVPGTESTPADPSDEATDVEADFVRGLPPGVSAAPEETFGGAAWTTDGSELQVVIFGSSSCPWVATDLAVEGSATVVTLEELGGAVCTMDFSPTTSTVPAGDVDSSVEQVITLGDLGVVTVPAASETVTVGWLPVGND